MPPKKEKKNKKRKQRDEGNLLDLYDKSEPFNTEAMCRQILKCGNAHCTEDITSPLGVIQMCDSGHLYCYFCFVSVCCAKSTDRFTNVRVKCTTNCTNQVIFDPATLEISETKHNRIIIDIEECYQQHQEEDTKCSFCNFTHKSMNTVSTHQLTCQHKHSFCPACKTMFVGLEQLEIHMMTCGQFSSRHCAYQGNLVEIMEHETLYDQIKNYHTINSSSDICKPRKRTLHQTNAIMTKANDMYINCLKEFQKLS